MKDFRVATYGRNISQKEVELSWNRVSNLFVEGMSLPPEYF